MTCWFWELSGKADTVRREKLGQMRIMVKLSAILSKVGHGRSTEETPDEPGAHSISYFEKSRQRAKTKFSDPKNPNDIILTFHWTLKTFPLQQGGQRESSRIEQVSWTNMPWNRKWPSIDFVCVQKDQFYSSFVFRLQCTKASASSRMCFLQTWSKWSYKSSVGAEST